MKLPMLAARVAEHRRANARSFSNCTRFVSVTFHKMQQVVQKYVYSCQLDDRLLNQGAAMETSHFLKGSWEIRLEDCLMIIKT